MPYMKTRSSQNSNRNVQKQNFFIVVNRISFMFDIKCRARPGENNLFFISIELNLKKISKCCVQAIMTGKIMRGKDANHYSSQFENLHKQHVNSFVDF